MGLEIERKFLLKDALILDFLTSQGARLAHLNITQFYTKITKDSECRYRSESDKFFKTLKFGRGLVRDESESECDEKEFNTALKSRFGALILKDRFLFKLNGKVCNIDIFKENLDGLCTFEIEFSDENEARAFRAPKFLESFITDEITYDERYKNKYLALKGNPNAKFDLNAAISVLQNHDIKLNLPQNIKNKDALCALFFKFYLLIVKNRDDYLKNYDDESLHQLRVNLRKTRSLLQLFNGVFDEKISQNFNAKFKALANLTNRKRDLDVLLGFLKEQKHTQKIRFFILKASEAELERIKNELKSEQNLKFLHEWELFLREDSDFYDGKMATSPLTSTAAFKIRSQLIKIMLKMRALNDESLNESFHKIRVELKRLRYALFSVSVFQFRGLDKFNSRLCEIQELFGKLQDRDIWLEILDKMPEVSGINKTQTKIYKKILKLRAEILSERAKFIRLAHKISRNLKIYYI